jgi:cytoskeletal protein RodZ
VFYFGLISLGVEMDEIGRNLRETRERLGLTLEEVERATRIRSHNLEAIETGDFDSLPSSVQARGFLHNYAEFLGLDANSILLQYAENLQDRRSPRRSRVEYKEPGTRPSVEIRSSRPTWLSTDLFIAAGITIVILVVLVWGGSSVMDSLRESSVPEEAVTEFLLPTVTHSPTPAQQNTDEAPTQQAVASTIESATLTPAVVIVPATRVTIQLVIEMRAWIQVIVDEKVEFRGRVLPGETLEFLGNDVVEVSTGNGAGVRVIYNGADQGLMGELGQVVSSLWTQEGILTPTPTETRTPLPTSTVTQTPVPSPTPPMTQTPTETQSAGG